MSSRALRHEDRLIPYQIRHKRSVTRRIHLRTAADGTLVVIAPRRMSGRAIHRMLQDRVQKVERFLTGARIRLKETPRLGYVDGEEHLYLGERYPLEIQPVFRRHGRVELAGGVIRVESAQVDADRIKRLLLAWYRSHATEYFSDRLADLAANATWVGPELPPIRLRKMKRTWGSCSGKGIITLNTRLIKAHPSCIDYVIAHELCHLEVMNHGKAFYALQEQLFPDWRAVRSRLRAQAHLYLID